MATQLYSQTTAPKLVRNGRGRLVEPKEGFRGKRSSQPVVSKPPTGWLKSEEFYVAGLLLVLFLLLLLPALLMIAYLIAVPSAFQ